MGTSMGNSMGSSMGNNMGSGMGNGMGSSMGNNMGSGMGNGMGNGMGYAHGFGNLQYARHHFGHGDNGFHLSHHHHGYGDFAVQTPYSGSVPGTFQGWDTPAGYEGNYGSVSYSSALTEPQTPAKSSHSASAQASAMGSMGPPPKPGYGLYQPMSGSPWGIAQTGGNDSGMVPGFMGNNVTLGPGFPNTFFHGLAENTPATLYGGNNTFDLGSNASANHGKYSCT